MLQSSGSNARPGDGGWRPKARGGRRGTPKRLLVDIGRYSKAPGTLTCATDALAAAHNIPEPEPEPEPEHITAAPGDRAAE
jgi:hypothetical protein